MTVETSAIRRTAVLLFVKRNPHCKVTQVVKGIGSNNHSVWKSLGELVRDNIITRAIHKNRSTYSVVSTDLPTRKRLKVTSDHLAPVVINYPAGSKRVVTEQEIILKPKPVRKIKSLFLGE